MGNVYPFDDWADIYDRVYADWDHDLNFYLLHAMNSGGPVLELGCGTGRVSIAIAELGLTVMGIDLSPRMLEAARRKAVDRGLDESCLFHHGDMRSFKLDQQFPLIVIPFRSFQSLLTLEDQRSTLMATKKHLLPGGKLIFDVFAPDIQMLATNDEGFFHIQDVFDPLTNNSLAIWGKNKFNHAEQTNHVKLFIDEVDSGGAILSRLYRDWVVRYFFRYEMQLLLENSGFMVEAVYGDFGQAPLNEHSDDMVWVARI